MISNQITFQVALHRGGVTLPLLYPKPASGGACTLFEDSSPTGSVSGIFSATPPPDLTPYPFEEYMETAIAGGWPVGLAGRCFVVANRVGGES
jgi:hypothetical protein